MNVLSKCEILKSTCEILFYISVNSIRREI
jgi:hypothetical protein